MLQRGTFAIVDERAIWHNVRNIRLSLDPAIRMLVAVKANGYGHGALQVAETVLSAGATDLGVASVEEALALRRGGIAAPILVLGAVTPESAQVAANWQIAVTLTDDWSSQDIPKFDSPLQIHLKVDSGMNRLGFRTAQEVLRVATWLKTRPDLSLAGMFTHLATADAATLAQANQQMEKFQAIKETLENSGISIPIVHAANSAATFRKPEWHFDMVRVGISAYGYAPSTHVQAQVPLSPALHLYSFISRVVTIEKGESVGYGATFTARRPTRIATLSVGYADGYLRILSNHAQVLVHGRRARVVGNVCMDQMTIDVTDIPDVMVGDVVTLYGREAPHQWTREEFVGKSEREQKDWLIRTFTEANPVRVERDVTTYITAVNSTKKEVERWVQGKPLLSLDELAGLGHTISYELMCGLSARVPRIYVKHYFDIRNSGSL